MEMIESCLALTNVCEEVEIVVEKVWAILALRVRMKYL